jgi:microcin C transport system permease protein
MRRAWWSLWLLLALYALSLGSELLCNGTPLYVRFNGRSYFPVFRYHPEDTFSGSGRQTRPDYKAIAASPEFRRNPANRMVFPPVPYGPNEIIDPDTIALSHQVTLAFRPAPWTAAVNIRPDYTVARGVSAGFFLGVPDDGIEGLCLTNDWLLPPPLAEAVASRFRNRAAPALAAVVTARARAGPNAEISLTAYEPREAPPTTVRLSLREIPLTNVRPAAVVVDDHGRVVRSDAAVWPRLAPETASNLLAAAAQRFLQPVDPVLLRLPESAYQVRFEKQDVRWPFPPVKGHWLGIDNAGRDVLARILYGLRTSMTFGLVLVFLSMALGVVIGAVQGYFGGAVDIAGQRFTEIWSALPFLYVVILLGSVYGRSFLLLLFCYGIFNWIGISYYMRAEFLRLRRQTFVEAARAMGLSHRRVIFRHVLPNALVPLITFSPFYLVGAIGSLAALDYLGFGLPPPTPSWGELLQQAQQFRWAWWLILYPSLALFVVMLLGVFVGEGVRNAYDPRPFSRME